MAVKELRTTKKTSCTIRPNPTGKDRPAHSGLSPAQLAAEWVDFRNDLPRLHGDDAYVWNSRQGDTPLLFNDTTAYRAAASRSTSNCDVGLR